ncbi:dihydrolipoyllysine-residue acetyltransferase [Thalassotalea mangrovi]|uniref:Dihydrolipoamide acetyltransferase component of pyruvate dehydrogenase complex n=1 Tax=Thalassotalea mangrovi TaxID=2572245 RepID=A0A4U1B5D3_9GAMM|nr:dihydrolipoyllysine-residue acetyltransferase [Thalassotalea mangrovi]TKB45637.1 dihydrolipoyllysine-residue acetyltransferase [Thalassotalea mangrovi]
MSIDFILPDIGEGIVECELVEWLVKEGDRIEEDQPVADVMTDKALVQIPAMYSGTVDKLYYKQGEIAKVHQPLFAMTREDDAAEAEAEKVTDNISDVPAVESVIASESSAGSQVEDFILPDIGEGIVECEIVDWLVNEGDIIEEDQAVVDVMTDKALVQIPAKYAGKVVKLHYAKGDIAKVHEPLFAIEHQGAAVTPANTQPAEATPSTVTSPKVEAPAAQTVNGKVAQGKALASPAVRRVAREMSVDIHAVPGSGPKGRVFKEDVVKFAQSGGQVSKAEVTDAAVSTSVAAGNTRVEPIRGVKAAMAKAMTASVSTIPHFTYCEEIDLTELIALRKSVKDEYAKQDIKLTMMPFFIKAMSLALKEFPVMNSQPNEDCTELTYFDDHNIGMAVDSKVGLLVPNVKQVQHKSIVDVAKDVMRLTSDARDGRVATTDLKGGTISISNIGALGGTVATPIINKPEVAIVALGKVQTLPRFDDKGEVQARSIMQVSWSGDHRIIDGGTIARFNNLWKSFLENPTLMLMHMS